MTAIATLERARQEDQKLKAILGYVLGERPGWII